MDTTESSLAGCSGEKDARQQKKPRTDDGASAEHALTEPGKSIFTAIKMHVDLFYLNSHPEAMYTSFIYADLSNLKSGNSSKLKFEVGTREINNGFDNDEHKASEMKIWINKAVVSGFKKLYHHNLETMHEKSSGNDEKYVKREDWNSTFQRASSELVRYMAKELHAPELNAPGLSAAVEDPFQVDEVMAGDEGTVTLFITRGNNKPIYVQNVLMQHAMAMVDENKKFGRHCAMFPKSEEICARLKAAFDNALRMARLAVEGSIIIVNVWDIGKQTSKEPNLNAVRKEKSLAHTPTRTSS
jgi:hypothetical protein